MVKRCPIRTPRWPRWQKTKKATVNEALREYIQRRQQATIMDLFGKIDMDPEYDHKRQRRRR